MENGENVVSQVPGDISAYCVLHGWESMFWPVGDTENIIIIGFFPPVVILQSEQLWGHILQPFLCSMTKITGSFLCVDGMAQVKLPALVRNL